MNEQLRERKQEDLEETVRKQRNKIESQRRKIQQQQAYIASIQTRQLHLFREQFRDLSTLLAEWNFSQTQTQMERVLALRVDKMLQRIRGGKDSLGELVKRINLNFDNILVHLRDDFPRMKDLDFRMFCYYAAGFPPEQIYLLLGLPQIAILYQRKARLVEKIQFSPSPRREDYLLLLSARTARQKERKSTVTGC